MDSAAAGSAAAAGTVGKPVAVDCLPGWKRGLAAGVGRELGRGTAGSGTWRLGVFGGRDRPGR